MGSLKQNSCVYYAITGRSFLFEQVLNSIASLRSFNKTIDIHVFVYGNMKAPTKKIQNLFNVSVHRRAAISKSLYPFFVKWIPLKELDYERVLLLDADTFFYSDVERLFKKYYRQDIYARKALGCSIGKEKLEHLNVGQDIKPKIWKKYQTSKAFPIFNVGIVLFNHGAHKKINFQSFLKNYAVLKSGKLPYPSRNLHNPGEYALALTLAKLNKRITWGQLTPSDAPYFLELRIDNTLKDCVLTHIFNNNYHLFFNENWDRAIGQVMVKQFFGPSRNCKFKKLNKVYLLNPKAELARPGTGRRGITILLLSEGKIVIVSARWSEIIQRLKPGRSLWDVLNAINSKTLIDDSAVKHLDHELQKLLSMKLIVPG